MYKSKKIGDASIRVLETLKLLYQKSVSIQDIIRHFEKLDANSKVYTSEVILKYINTLKVFGLKVLRDKDKYVLLNVLKGFDFDENDLKIISLIEKYNALFPEELVKAEVHKFLQELEKYFDEKTINLAKSITNSGVDFLKFDYLKYEHQIHECEKYCLDKQRLKVVYKNNKNAEISIMIEPLEIKYFENQVYLSVYNQLSAQIQDISLDSILKIEQLPLKSNSVNMYSSVMFALKGRLAKNYRLHGEEKLVQSRIDGSIVIQNQKEDRQMLKSRLMRYGELCEVLSPKSFRQEMHQLIKSTLALYD